MRYPLWILNSTLFIFALSAVLFIIFSREDLPEREEITSQETVRTTKKTAASVNIKQIYESDLFGTYVKPRTEEKEPKYIVPLPEPPTMVQAEVPKKIVPTFLEPLGITLKGVMSSYDSSKSKVIISDNKTNRESIYQVGDKIEDALLIRIFKNKVIFVRASGQQEVFYLRKEDAQSDPTYLVIDDWKGVVRKIAPNYYSIDKKEFCERIHNLAQFIDILNLATVYKMGQSIGCRVGSSEVNSLAQELGLVAGDTILTINQIPATTTDERLKIYKNVVVTQLGETITVQVLRSGKNYTLRYKLSDFSLIKKPTEPGKSVTTRYIEEEQKKMLESKHTFAPTIEEIRRRERQNMINRGKKGIKHFENKAIE